MEDKNEQNRITLSIAFIATYLAIIANFYEKIKIPTAELKIINDIIFNVFIIYGVLISFIFFLYLAFTALGLSFGEEKQIILEFEISRKKILDTKRKLFNWGVRCIFISFSVPIYYIFLILKKNYSLLKTSILFFLILLVIYVFLAILFQDKNKKQ